VIFLFGCATVQAPTQRYNPPETTQQKFDYSKYHPSKLTDIAKEHDKSLELDSKNAPPGKAFICIEAAPNAIRVKAEFCNEFRTPSEEHMKMVKSWLKALGHEKYIGLFQHEVKLREDDIEYWLPIQEQLIPFLQREINTGEIAEFYIVYYGAYNFDHVFVINEFQKVQ